MPSFRTVASVATGIVDDGKYHEQLVYKSNAPTMSVAGRWGDLSMGGGLPKYNAYVGGQAEATQLIGSANNGIFTGATTGSKNLLTISAYSPAAATYLLADYLMFYPLIDGDNTDEQLMDNPVGLPRYTTGEGVRAALICTTAGATNATFNMRYVDETDTTRTTNTLAVSAVNLGNIANSASATANSFNCFIPLNGGKGIKRVEALTFITPPSGFYSLLLFKPLCNFVAPEGPQHVEKTFIHMQTSLPEVQQGAFLNFLFNTQSTGTLAGFRALMTFTWS